jgi:hypothetical protein
MNAAESVLVLSVVVVAVAVPSVETVGVVRVSSAIDVAVRVTARGGGGRDGGGGRAGRSDDEESVSSEGARVTLLYDGRGGTGRADFEEDDVDGGGRCGADDATGLTVAGVSSTSAVDDDDDDDDVG